MMKVTDRAYKIIRNIMMYSLIIGFNNLTAAEIDLVVKESAMINDSATQSQNKIDKISEDIANKLQAYKSAIKETKGLIVYEEQMKKQITNQNVEMKRINQSMDKVSVIERQITPLMLRMIEGLNDFIVLDVPFLVEERSTRVNSLRKMMDRSDIAASEKFRRILEAYQIEVDYGHTIEAYSSNVKVEGKDQIVNLLRIGRISLIYQSKDRKHMGLWKQDKKIWHELDDSYTTQVTKGLRMAQKQQAPDMLVMPISAPINKQSGK